MKLFASITNAVVEGLVKQAIFFCIVIIGFLTYATTQGLDDALSAYGTRPAQCPATVVHSRSF